MGQEKNTRKMLIAEGHNLGGDKRRGESVIGNGETLRPYAAPQNTDRRNSFTKEQTLQHGADTYDRLAAIVRKRKGKKDNKDNDKRKLDSGSKR